MPGRRNDNQQEPLKKSDWIQYLSHIASYTQNYYMGYANIFFAVLAILAVIISVPDYPIWQSDLITITTRPILSLIVIIFIILIRGIPGKINFSKDVLTGKSANRLLSNIFSNQYPELKNSKGIQKKWGELKQKIENTSDKERKQLLQMRTRKIPDEQRFANWFNQTPKQLK